MTTFFRKVRVFFGLGGGDVWRVLTRRLGLKLGISSVPLLIFFNGLIEVARVATGWRLGPVWWRNRDRVMGVLSRFADRVATGWRLGPVNVALVLLYRILLRLGLFRWQLPLGEPYDDPLFREDRDGGARAPAGDGEASGLAPADHLLDGRITLFSHRRFRMGSPPDWFRNPYSGGAVAEARRHWSQIGDFLDGVGDIKCVWEISRFDWALTLARAYRGSSDRRYLQRLIEWSADWTSRNPVNAGPNWKCGQEASIRMLQVLLTAYLLGEDEDPLPGLVRFVEEHCQRIQPTFFYARGQDNNHGISEAAALFIAGGWLQGSRGGADGGAARSGKAARFKRLGRRWLEERVARLIQPDGSFSQYSVNYHRMVVDTLCLAEFWRRRLNLPAFTDQFYHRAKVALDWLWQLTDAESGGAPNLGHNDGTRLFNLSPCAYNDHRPTLQLGHALFHGQRLLGPGPWDHPLTWLGVSAEAPPANAGTKASRVFGDGGFVVLRPGGGKGAFAVVRMPNFKFRPGHADALHFDLWVGGLNLLRDSGSFSYNAPAPWQSHFAGTAAHNTVEFDGRDQMPRPGRFLFGAWLPRQDIGEVEADNGGCRWQGGYQDRWRARHHRSIAADGRKWTIVDRISGYRESAILRWHLAPGDWQMKDGACVGEWASIRVTAEPGPRRMELVSGWESLYYQNKTAMPVLEVEFAPGEAVVRTEIRLRGD